MIWRIEQIGSIGKYDSSKSSELATIYANIHHITFQVGSNRLAFFGENLGMSNAHQVLCLNKFLFINEKLVIKISGLTWEHPGQIGIFLWKLKNVLYFSSAARCSTMISNISFNIIRNFLIKFQVQLERSPGQVGIFLIENLFSLVKNW